MAMKSLNNFKELNREMDLPSMKDSFCDHPYEGKEDIVKYLENGKKTMAACSRALDAFTGEVIPGERCLMTDGEYSWSSCLSYYVDKYNLRLLPEFEKKVLAL